MGSSSSAPSRCSRACASRSADRSRTGTDREVSTPRGGLSRHLQQFRVNQIRSRRPGLLSALDVLLDLRHLEARSTALTAAAELLPLAAPLLAPMSLAAASVR